MFPLNSTKIAIIVVFLTVTTGLGFIAAHYHDKWVDDEVRISALQRDAESFKSAAQTCSDNTIKLYEVAQAKAEDIKKAQAQAAIVARANESMAQTILGAKGAAGVDSCAAAMALYKSYKKGEIK